MGVYGWAVREDEIDEYYKIEERRTKNEKSIVAYGQIAVGVWLRTMKVEPKDVDSRRYRQYVGCSPVSTAECNDARYI